MYGTTVVSGKVIEYRKNRVVIKEGDAVSTYNLSYYRLLQEEQLSSPLSADLFEELLPDPEVLPEAGVQPEAEILVQAPQRKRPFLGQLLSFSK
ncbi:hypothetical protein [Paenibacillus gansuensis]|uniref:Uncharacterized protein n=1 Tax=Paenibacillus gansuensis TaxID=306542 RepID=A0ABW5PEY2_9BACL